MTEQSMIELVARAILDSLDKQDVYTKTEGGDLSLCTVDGGLFDMRDVARAAIEAMREPNKSMARLEITKEVWRAMIDAALKED